MPEKQLGFCCSMVDCKFRVEWSVSEEGRLIVKSTVNRPALCRWCKFFEGFYLFQTKEVP